MTTVAILGAGAGGAAATAELMQSGYRVRLWSRSPATLSPFQESGHVAYDGVLGPGQATPELISDNLEATLENTDGILVCLPTLAHGQLAGRLAELGQSSVPVVLNPGHTGGAMEFHHTYVGLGVTPPPLAEFSTLTYVARKNSPDTVTITGTANQVRVAGMLGNNTAIKVAQLWYPNAVECKDVIATSLANVNLVLHPPGCVLAAAWIEATKGDFTFYVEGMTDGVGHVMYALDQERRSVAQAFGHTLPSLIEEMSAIGTVEQGAAEQEFADNIRGGKANKNIKAPDSFQHRYYKEDFWFGLTPFIAFADAVGAQVPVAKSLMTLAAAMSRGRETPGGRTAQQMGINGMDGEQIIVFVRGGK